jgi:hypothetical protein
LMRSGFATEPTDGALEARERCPDVVDVCFLLDHAQHQHLSGRARGVFVS